MEPVLGSLPLCDWHTSVTECLNWQDGRLTRSVIIRGILRNAAGADAIELALDTVIGGLGTAGAPLRLRPGRIMMTRLRQFRRERHATHPAGAFTLELDALSPWEESEMETGVLWQVTAPGVAGMLFSAGTAPTPLRLEFIARGNVPQPVFGDGIRSMQYGGTVPDGATLALDGPAGRLLVAGEDETAYASGDFPMATPGETAVYFSADTEESLHGTLRAQWRDRWY